jgi:alpha-amylase/alpha-mannosidase (GH57 family)
MGPFTDGDRVTYHVRGGVGETEVVGPTASFLVGPKLYLALLWHQHQPIYKDTLAREPRGSYLHPWVRFHALRDYYSMARIAGEHAAIHRTVNVSGSLLWQLKDYLEAGYRPRSGVDPQTCRRR